MEQPASKRIKLVNFEPIDLLQKKITAPLLPVSSIHDYIESCHIRFQPEAAKDLTAVYQFILKDKASDDCHHFHLDIDKERGCFLKPEEHPSPSVTIATNVDHFLKMSNGEVNPFISSMTGRVKIKGPLDLKLKLTKLMAVGSPKPPGEGIQTLAISSETLPTAQEFRGMVALPVRPIYSYNLHHLIAPRMVVTADDVRNWYKNNPINLDTFALYEDEGSSHYLYFPELQKFMAAPVLKDGDDQSNLPGFTAADMQSAFAVTLAPVDSEVFTVANASNSSSLMGNYTPDNHCGYSVVFPINDFTNFHELPGIKSTPPSYQELILQKEWSDMKLNQLYLSHLLTDVTGITLSNVCFDNSTLIGADFSGNSFSGSVTFKSSDLSNASFKSLQISTEVDFSEAKLVGCNFSYCKFATGFSFKGFDLTDVSFNGATFPQCIFDSASLEKTDFSSAAFSDGVSMRNVDLTSATVTTPLNGSEDHLTDLTSATLPLSYIGIDWSFMILENSVINGLDSGTDLSKLNANNADLSGLEFNKNKMSGSTFDDATLTNTAFTQCDLTDATFDNATFNGTQFTHSILVNANMSGAQLGKTGDEEAVDFSFAYLNNINFNSANLYQVSLAHVQMYGDKTNLNNAHMVEAKLPSSILSSAKLAGVPLSGASLDSAVLIGCDLTNADLSPSLTNTSTLLTKASLQGADFTGAKLQRANLANAAVAMENGVPLFSIDASTYTADLDAGKLSDDLRKEFRSRDFILSDDATVKVVTAGSQWEVEDVIKNVSPGNYIQFNLCTLQDDKINDDIRIYGKVVVIQRLKSTDQGDKIEKVEATYLPTKISADNFDQYTICPNNIEYGNQSSGTTFEEMMTANTLIPPPKCIPDPMHWCPHSQ